MPQISNPGTYSVIIKEPRWERLDEKDGDKNRIQLVLPCYTVGEGEEQHLDFHLQFTSTIISKGANRGRALYEISAETCVKLGMSEPFSPKKINELNGVEAELVAVKDTYKKQDGTIEEKIKGQFLNGRRRPTLPVEEACQIWEALKSGSIGGSEDDESDVPF